MYISLQWKLSYCCSYICSGTAPCSLVSLLSSVIFKKLVKGKKLCLVTMLFKKITDRGSFVQTKYWFDYTSYKTKQGIHTCDLFKCKYSLHIKSYFSFRSGSAYNRSLKLICLVMLLHDHYLCLIDAVEEIGIREYKQHQNQHQQKRLGM